MTNFLHQNLIKFETKKHPQKSLDVSELFVEHKLLL